MTQRCFARLIFLFVCLFLTGACSREKAKSSDPVVAPSSATPPGADQRKKTELSYADRKTWRTILQWQDSCENDFDSRDGAWSGLTFWPVGPKKYLVEVQCFLAAYQANHRYALIDESREPPAVQWLSFIVYSSADGKKVTQERSPELAGLSEFKPQTKELIVTSKARGLGDCGSYAVYDFKNSNGDLKEFREKSNCDGKIQEPNTYPRLYPQ
jgi:hypothetical protein